MSAPFIGGADPLLAAYLLAFGVAAVACFASLSRARRIDDRDTRHGLIALLATSGGWAIAQVTFLLIPSRELKVAFYILGLVIGLSTVGPWLYFCSAYAGRSLHRDPTSRRALFGVFLGIVLLKVTNPVHELYFTAKLVESPFLHLAITPGTVNWVVLGLAYVLAAIGYFMLFELFEGVGHGTRPLAILAGIAGLPVVLDLAALWVPELLKINYEPLGVAAFGVGLLFLYVEDFRTVQLAGDHDNAIVVLDDADRIRDYNATSLDLFPDLDGSVGEPIVAVLPELADLRDGNSVVETDRIGGMRYLQITENPYTAGGTQIRTILSFTDVTDREEYRQELERQNDRLDQFASMVSHDLRNPLTVAEGNVELLRNDDDREELEAAAEALDRMEELIEDLLALAREGQPIDDTEPVDLADLAEQSWGTVSTTDADRFVEASLAFRADPDRLRQLLENLFRNAIEHGREDVTITVGALDDETGFFVADDGPGIPEENREEVFGSGFTTSEDGTGFGLAIVREIAEAHGWEIRVTESANGGARFEVSGVELCES